MTDPARNLMTEMEHANRDVIYNTLGYIIARPIQASLEAQLRPKFSFKNNLRDTTLQLAMQLCLMGSDSVVTDLFGLTINEKEFDAGKILEKLYQTFRELAKTATTATQIKELKKLKKYIHAFALLVDFNLKANGKEQLVNLEKLLVRYETNLNEYRKLEDTVKDHYKKIKDSGDDNSLLALPSRYESGISEPNFFAPASTVFEKLNSLHTLLKQDRDALFPFIEENNSTEENKKKYRLRQLYAVVRGIAPITSAEKRMERKATKARINQLSFGISLIVGLGEGLIAAVYAAAAWPFFIALLVVGLPAAICNYYLFRGDSFSVMKEIWYGKVSDTPATRTLKNISTVFSAMAGISYGFLSFGSALAAFGHVFFGLTMAAAIATPPGALIVIAAVVAVVTAVALTTLYDYMIRRFIDGGGVAKLKQMKKDFIEFFKPENDSWKNLNFKQKCQHVALKVLQASVHVIFFAIAIVISAVVVTAVMPLLRHKAANILHSTFKIASRLSDKLANGIVIGMGAVVNGAFYSKSVFTAVNLMKKAVQAVIHPKATLQAVRDSFKTATSSVYKKIETAITFVKRLFLFGTVAMNSGVGQGAGAGRNPAAQANVHDLFPRRETDDVIVTASMTLGSGGANAAAVVAATKPATVVTKPAETTSHPSQAGLFHQTAAAKKVVNDASAHPEKAGSAFVHRRR
ncbi:MAG: hypothetical protein A3I77_05375 [Gammaproteobacteria bacterium RIFCSPLOWO2_02_FULL_42_14]|nr:MAG: hypothetical protein A3B71_01940 [Gammaproteobacteria bacterium RIFCSPHIGHO2_02_FULL_42_43]OGT28367.1 MAG: hypothetical protein A2624_02850 [Gammaproteobacteria bacterium RIFCSPHIGHO2_01_FULL_42_8]OGT51203.1 MAG: hypothetical protein A3E54_03130 [Gammaproteobacteria bacterium RIFCSPHIGHO2_12_FULL_41_25]OGT62965.1 MAG: hypothetical protein A3I77_05375 [Gammaproteobacteria bacterium RIFCSPLOWO2_02_FULL_42_14]OGT86097.1 MAG: hypothetical protein A3G86_02930 [Gammaproteobacteria bacterium R